jgi:hypothetical protein
MLEDRQEAALRPEQTNRVQSVSLNDSVGRHVSHLDYVAVPYFVLLEEACSLAVPCCPLAVARHRIGGSRFGYRAISTRGN